MNDWNPSLYMQFKSERTQPSVDLISKIDHVEPKSIIDIGCGPGNSTQVLVNRWSKSQITGLDSSAAMIEKAKRDYPNQEWLVADASTYESETKFDIVFSNAVIQWLPNHDLLLTKFHDLLSTNGVLAVQIPLFWDMPLGKLINNTAQDDRWKTQTEGVSDLFTIHDYSFYYEHLANIFTSVDIWKTDYIHILNSHESILEMIRSTGLKPYLERMHNDSDKKEFEEVILKEIIKAYPVQKNGKVLFPFNRLFFIGYK